MHSSISAFLALALASTAVIASPIAAPAVTPAPDPNSIGKLRKRTDTCTFSGSEGASSASVSKTDCSTIILDNVAVPSGVTLDLEDLTEDTVVIFEGTTTFGYEAWSGPLVSVSGTDITVKGADGAILDGDGSRWWDGEGSNGGVTKPTFFYAHNLLGSSTIEDIYILNPPVQVFSIDGADGLTFTSPYINCTAGNDGGAANTDCFDIDDSESVTITDATCYNQDDCVAINSGTDITFTGGLCSGGHGLSVGSVGGRSDNTVETVLFESSTVEASQNGVRIKTVYNATGTVKDVTYKDITLSGITDYGIVVEQDYENGSPTGTPTDGVPITDFVLDSVTGTVEDTGYNVYILCAACSDWTWTDVDVTGGKTDEDCEGVPSGASCSD